ncbi:tRNA lysidine(34) synthetase TilS [Thermaurantiacus tibetensis]|uniref:tRNA lysidine(34) synthetase TilS n=1 Tax=Thermaurantiacus tibetensis TaxID=2759035 RepID=UPI0018904988|nr:tRNA lysidine(34) synthetase TilS [Thermaurantiacus tibetensis]
MRTLTSGHFAATVHALLGPAADPSAPLALAVSGGADSLALLVLAAEAFAGRVAALTVDHGLRPEARAEAEAVARAAAARGVPHAILAIAPPGPSNLQADARAARYAAMADWCRSNGMAALLTAHHLDDQAETLLLRLARGSGLAGLAGIRARAVIAGLPVLRPLLDWPRATLARITREAGLVPADDPSNRDPRFDRTRARALLGSCRWLAPARLAASAAHLADAEEALAWAAERAWASRARAQGGGWELDPEALPGELRRRLLLKGFAALGAPAPRGPALARLIASLEAGRRATLGGIAARPLADGRWRLLPAPPRRRPAGHPSA